MRSWPVIEDAATLEWLALDHDAWVEAMRGIVRRFGSREFDEAALERALGYPWERPEGSYVLRDGVVSDVHDRSVVEEFAVGRFPLVAFGANGAPARLVERFAAFEEPRDRDVLVLTGWLHDVEIAAGATVTIFGNVPAVLVPCPGTAVRAAALWLTSTQLAAITKMELGYHFGRLERAWFEMDEAGVTVDELFAYVHRIGALCLDGESVALAAVPARDRSLRAMTQEELLDRLAALVIGPEARAEDLVRRCLDDVSSVFETMRGATWPHAIRLPDDHWTPYPT